MSIRNLTTENNINLFCSDFECKNMICANMTIPQGGDLNAHDVKVDNDLLVKTQDGLNYIKYNTPNKGNAGEQLTVDANGNAYWSNSAGPGGVSNPMATDLNTNGFILQNNIGTNSNINITPTNILTTGDFIINDNLIMSGEIKGTSSITGLILDSIGTPNNNITMKGGEVIIDNTSGINMNTKNISNCNIIKSNNNDLVISGENGGFPAKVILSGNQIDISAPNGVDMKDHDINNCSAIFTKNINNVKIIRSESDFNGSTNLSGIYHIYDKVSLTNSYTVIGDTSIVGFGREVSSLDFDNPDPQIGFCISNTDHNLDLINLNMSNTSASFDLIECKNVAKDKIFTVSNCAFRNNGNQTVIYVEGFDLVDFNQTLMQYNNVNTYHLYVLNASKLQISSCEFLRQLSQNNPSSYGTANMVELQGTMGAFNISSSLFHPQQTQSSIMLKSGLSALEGVISGNTFISLGLTTGQLINYDGGSIDNYPFLVVSDNSGIRNEKAIVELALEGNTEYTSTILNQYVALNTPNITFPVLKRFTSLGNTLLRYDGKKPIYVNINCNLLANQADDKTNLVRFGIQQNGILVSSLGFTVEDNKDRSFGYTATLILNNLDEIVFVCQNIDAGTSNVGFRAIDVNISIVEV